MTRHDFPTRLRYARTLIARGASALPVHVVDQLAAAGSEAHEHHDRIAAMLPILEPGRNWRQRLDGSPSDDTRAYLLAAAFGCTTVCPHLLRGGPQPIFFRLPVRRADCQRCARMLRRAPSGEDDRCDICGTHGVSTFHPFAVRLGPALILGDACSGCAEALGIVMEAAS